MSSVVIPIYPSAEAEGIHVELPDASENLFGRIIRDPNHPDRPMRERRCAEMLCALLQNCPKLRDQTFQMLAERCGWADVPLDEMTFQVDTERSIGRKRDDLRIEGYLVDDPEPVLLWTVEVKVQAGIHRSSYQGFSDEDDPSDEHDVPQLENYDRWLSTNEIRHKAGIVLSIRSMEGDLQSLDLRETWVNLLWTDLGAVTELALENEKLPEVEQMFARHFLGFLFQHLWDMRTMSSERLGINDLALIRAFMLEGDNCSQRVDRLVEPLVGLMEDTEVNFAEVKHEQVQMLFSSRLRRSSVKAYFFPNEGTTKSVHLSVVAGIHEEHAFVQIEANPRCNIFTRIQTVCEQHYPDLHERNSKWIISKQDKGDWHQLRLNKPLAWLLAEEDQQSALSEFVFTAVLELQNCGLIAALQRIPQEAGQ